MKFFKTVFALAVVGVTALEVAPLKNRSVEVPVVVNLSNHSVVHSATHSNHSVAQSANHSNHSVAHSPDPAAEVASLRGKLEHMAAGLEAMLVPMNATQIGPELKTFVTELHAVLKETSGMKDTAAALKKLQAARAGVAQLTHDLTKRQVDIMKDEESAKDSLLLGVLMTRQKDPMAEQLAVLKSDDFVMLPVSQVLLAKHNDSTPLFGQAAAYLDTHATKGIKVRARTLAEQKAEQEATGARLQKSVDSLQKVYDSRVKHNAEREKELEADLKKAKTEKSKKVLQAIKKREERNFKKWAVMQKHDIAAMTEAVAAVKRGDMNALNKARAALKQSMDALQDKNAGFLVLLSLGHRMLEQDCPYCVAQCVDKCHEEGKPYTQCLTDCADAGK